MTKNTYGPASIRIVASGDRQVVNDRAENLHSLIGLLEKTLSLGVDERTGERLTDAKIKELIDRKARALADYANLKLALDEYDKAEKQ